MSETPDLRYVTVRLEDSDQLHEALGLTPGTLVWHRLLARVRELRGEIQRLATMERSDGIEILSLENRVEQLSAELASERAHQGQASRDYNKVLAERLARVAELEAALTEIAHNDQDPGYLLQRRAQLALKGDKSGV
jgi:hypothetical protein